MFFIIIDINISIPSEFCYVMFPVIQTFLSGFPPLSCQVVQYFECLYIPKIYAEIITSEIEDFGDVVCGR
jgi:hypothetical protein